MSSTWRTGDETDAEAGADRSDRRGPGGLSRVGPGGAGRRQAAPACITRLIIDRQEDSNGNDSPYLTVNTKFWEVDSLKQDVWHTVFRTVHVGDEVKAYDADWPDRDDRIDSDVVTGFTRGTLVFIGQGAKYRATYHSGAC